MYLGARSGMFEHQFYYTQKDRRFDENINEVTNRLMDRKT